VVFGSFDPLPVNFISLLNVLPEGAGKKQAFSCAVAAQNLLLGLATTNIGGGFFAVVQLQFPIFQLVLH
jgi:hypothetical protein